MPETLNLVCMTTATDYLAAANTTLTPEIAKHWLSLRPHVLAAADALDALRTSQTKFYGIELHDYRAAFYASHPRVVSLAEEPETITTDELESDQWFAVQGPPQGVLQEREGSSTLLIGRAGIHFRYDFGVGKTDETPVIEWETLEAYLRDDNAAFSRLGIDE